MTSCLGLAWWRQVLSLSASRGGSMATVNPATNTGLTRVPSTQNEVSILQMHHLLLSELGSENTTNHHGDVRFSAPFSAICRKGVFGDHVGRVHRLPLLGEPRALPAVLPLRRVRVCGQRGVPLLRPGRICSSLRCQRSAAQLEVPLTLW